MFEQHLKGTMEVIDQCVRGCILYYDANSSVFDSADPLLRRHHRNSHRTYCPLCNELRYTPNGKPRKVLYYFPLAHYFSGLYGRPDLIPYMRNDQCHEAFPSGSVRRSKRWATKVRLIIDYTVI